MRKYLSALLFLTLSLAAEDGEQDVSTGEAESETVIMAQMKGLALVGSDEIELADVNGLKVEGLDIPGNFSQLKARLEPLFMHKPLTKGLLLQLKSEIINYYKSNNRPFVAVEIPPQDVTCGVVRLVVTEAQLGCVTCQCNEHFSCGSLARFIHIDPGQTICSDVLLGDIAFLNRSPFHRTSAAFVPGQAPKTTDIVLMTEDRLSWRFYAGGDNTGNRFSGNARWFAGFNWGNVFGWDHILSYQYTTSNDFHEFQSHTFHYKAPTTFRRTTFVLYGGFSHVKPSLSSLNGDVKPPGKIRGHGVSSQLSGRYYFPLGSLWESSLLEFNVGFDYKHMNNNLDYIGDNTIPIIFKSVNLTQFVQGLNYGFENRDNKFSLEADLFWSPGQLFSNGNNTDFNNVRNRAKNRYIYGRLFIGEVFHMNKGWDLSFYARGQGASSLLLPSEQFGLGGYDTVRGYDEREYNADQAVLGTLELRAPPLSFFRMCGCKRRDQLTFLIFGDYARGWDFKSLTNERKTEWLAGVGPGLRYTIDRYLTARLDYGIKLHKDSAIGHQFGKIHASVIASY